MSSATEDGSILDSLARRQLLVVTGKGGVGKTTLSVVLAKLLAGRGRCTLVLEVDPRESAHQMLEVSPSGGAIETVAPGLLLQNLRPRQVLDELVKEQLQIATLSRTVLGHPVYRHFAEGAPGLEELAILGHTLRLLRGVAAPSVDTVVLDAPATGHGVSLLMAPQIVAQTIRTGPFGRMASELARFIADPGACAVVVASQAEEMPVQEALELLVTLDNELDRAPAFVALNAVYPPLPAALLEPEDALARLWAERRGVNERERDRLRRAWDGPLLDLPLLPLERGPRLVEALVSEAESWLQEERAWA